MDANKILATKKIPEMTDEELLIVMNRAKEAHFENALKEEGTIDLRKREMGLWALNIFKDKKVDFVSRQKVKEKHKDEINYYLKNKVLPKPSGKNLKIKNLLDEIEKEFEDRQKLN